MYYIYVYKDPITLLPFYIGKGKNYRFRDHINYTINRKHYNKHLENKILKIQSLGLEPIIDKYNFSDENIAYAVEEAVMRQMKELGIKLCNLLTGGSGGQKHSQETKDKMSKIQSKEGNGFYNRHHTEETKKSISDKLKGKVFSEETRKKISQAKSGENHHFYKKSTPNKGIKMSDEQKKKISETLKKKNVEKRVLKVKGEI